MQTTEIRETWTALYARLSLDDGNVGESMSHPEPEGDPYKEKQKNWEFIIIGFMQMMVIPVRISTVRPFNR